MNRTLEFSLKAAIVGPLLLGFAGAANGADINTANRCDARGAVCVNDCNPTRYQAQTEDDPCWVIQSCDSDWEVPFFAFQVKDYRDACRSE